jgi:hypothetical protein
LSQKEVLEDMNMPLSVKENNKILSYFPHTPKNLYFDVALSIAFDRPILDFWKFDDFLHQIYGKYDDEQGLSMHDLLVKEKGADFAKYIEELI